ncbi:MAG: IS630 transposase-related protein [Planctomycetes bacterium]|nr:IS630 transposase-related protein [Planctomycetota bacterium]
MASPYSKDLRLKVLAAYERGMMTSAIARAFSVCPAWARRVKQRFRESGEVEARPMGGARYIKISRQQLAELVAQHPDATLAELCELIDVQCSQSGIGYALQSLDLTLKKKRSTRRSRIVRTWQRDAKSGAAGSKRLMSID